jgi:folate-binding protein YgfZ
MSIRATLYAIHQALGAVFDDRSGEVPSHYGDPAAEHAAVREAAGLFDRSHVGKIEVTGRDRVSFLQGMLTNDLKALKPGQGCPAALLDVHGKVQALMVAFVADDRLFLELPPGTAWKTLRLLDKFLITEKVHFADVTEAFACFSIQGPMAGRVLGNATGSAVSLDPFCHEERRVNEVAARIFRVDETGETGFHVWAPVESVEPVWKKLLEAGRPFDLRPAGFEALDALRVEAGIPWYGRDVDESVLLPEIPLDPMVSYTKGCYLGQEIVARVKYRGQVRRLLAGFVLDGERVPAPGAVLIKDCADVGRITSAVRSFSLNRPIALGFVRREWAEPGTVLTIRDGEATLTAQVSELPFYRKA